LSYYTNIGLCPSLDFDIFGDFLVIKKFKKRYLLAAIVLIAILTGLAVAEMLTTYTTTISITGFIQLSQGATTSSWTVYPNEIATQYVPGGASEPTFNPDATSTYAFNVTTDSHEACSVEINLAAPVSSDFSSFQITVLRWTGSEWSSATLYAAATGGSTITYIDGTQTNAVGYVREVISSSTYFLVEIAFNYTPTGTPGTYTVNLQFTPYPETPS
jgi:hypothetical protein